MKMVDLILTESEEMHVPTDVKELANSFEIYGHELYIVGGAIRDFLLGKDPKDYDLATDATPDESIEIIKNVGFDVVEVGKEFGVVSAVTADGSGYEIATFRADIGSGRNPDGVKFTDISTDVKRRDLTINALFYNINTGEIVDLVGGRDDLNKGLIRTVGDPDVRFEEDKLRKLRALRFYARVGKDIDPETYKALADSDLEGVSNERIRDEFTKSVKTAKSVVEYLQMCHNLGYLSTILGDLFYDSNFIEERNIPILFAFMLRNNSMAISIPTLKDLRYEKDEIRKFDILLQVYTLLNGWTLISSGGDHTMSRDLTNVYDVKRQLKFIDDDELLTFGSYINGDKFVRALIEFDLSSIDVAEIRKEYSGKAIGDEMRRQAAILFNELL